LKFPGPLHNLPKHKKDIWDPKVGKFWKTFWKY